MEKGQIGFRLLKETVGIPIEIISNELNEISTNTYHKIVLQIQEDEPPGYMGNRGVVLPIVDVVHIRSAIGVNLR